MAQWPNNYITGISPYRKIGLLPYSGYNGIAGSRQNFFTAGIDKRASTPSGYGMGASNMLPITAGGISSYSQGRIQFSGTSSLISGGAMSGSFSMSFNSGSTSLSLITSMSGTSTITLTSGSSTLALTVGLGGSGSWSLQGTSSLSLVVPFSGLGAFSLTGVSDLKGILSLEGEWTPFTELSPENLANSVWGTIVENGINAKDALKILTAIMAGETVITPTGGGTATVTFKAVNNPAITRVVADMIDSERDDVTLTL